MSFMYSTFRKALKEKVLGSDGAMDEFRSGVADDDPRLIQLVKDHPDYKKKCVPIIIHGDGVPCTNNHSLDAISVESIFAKRSVGTACSALDYMFFITGVFTQTMSSDEGAGLGNTKIEMWKLVVHSLRACHHGRWPGRDPMDEEFTAHTDNHKKRGHPVASGYVLVPWVLKGDMDFNINHFEMPGHWGSNYPCPACPCDRVQDSPMAWNNFSPDAAWKARVFETLVAFVTHCAMLGKTVHQIFETLDNGGLGMHPRSAYKDSLHVVDLGVGMHVCGNVLHFMCFDKMLPHTPATNMEKLWNDIDKLYHERDTSSQFPNLSLGSFCDPD